MPFVDESGKPVDLSPQEQAQYWQQSGQQPPGTLVDESGKPLDPFSLPASDIADLVKQNPDKFDLVSQFASRPELQKDPAMVSKVADAFHQVRQQPVDWLDLLKKAPGNVTNVIGGLARFGGTAVSGTLKEFGALGIAATPKPGAEEAAAVAQEESRKELGEVAAASEQGMTGLVSGAVKTAQALGRGLGLAKSLKDYTPQDKVNALFDALATTKQAQATAAGQGPIAQAVTGGVVPVPPEETAKLSDPFSWEALGLGTRGIAAAAKAVPIPEAVSKLAEKIPTPAEVAGKTITGAAKVGAAATRAAEKVVTPVAAIGTPIYAALTHDPRLLAESVLFGSSAGEKAATLAEKAATGLDKAAEFGKQLSSGEIKSAYAGAVQDALNAAPAAAGQLATGLGFDLSQVAGADTPQEREAAVGLGTAFGLLGAANTLGRHVISGQIIGPRAFDINTQVAGSGAFPALEDVSKAAFQTLNPGQRARINAIRLFTSKAAPGTDIFVADPNNKPALADALVKAGMPADKAAYYSNQNGFSTRLNGRKVIVVIEPGSAPHEAFHGMEDVLGEATLRNIDPEMKAQYANQWEDFGRYYASRLIGRDAGENWRDVILDKSGWGNTNAAEKAYATTAEQFAQEARRAGAQPPTEEEVRNAVRQNGVNWRTDLSPEEQQSIADRYISRELLAENFDAWFKHAGPTLEPGRQMPERIARTLGHVMEMFGENPIAGRRTTGLGVPLTLESIRTARLLGTSALGETKPTVVPVGRAAAAPIVAPAGAAPASDLGDQARKLAQDQPDVPLPGQNQSQREIAGAAAEAFANDAALHLQYSTAPDQPAASLGLGLNRADRRSMIEAFRQMPDSARTLFGKLFFPKKFVQTKASGLQIQGWSPEVFAANAHRWGKFVAERGLQAPYETDANGLTEKGWTDLYNDLQTYVKNQRAGLTGAGETLVVPRRVTEAGYFAPPTVGESGGALNQRKADVINMLFGFRLPGTEGKPTRAGGAAGVKLPQNIAGRLVSEATLAGRVSKPVTPREPFGGAAAIKQGVSGEPVMEVNPYRAEIEQAAKDAGVEPPSMIESWQNLNLNRIKEAEVAPEQPKFGANPLTLQAGFMPSGERKSWEFEPTEALSQAGKALERQGYVFGHGSNENLLHGVTVRTPDGKILGAAQGTQISGPQRAAIGDVIADNPEIGKGLRAEMWAYLRSKGYSRIDDYSQAGQFAPASDKQMAEYERLRGAYEATPWWKQPFVGESETGRHSSFVGDTDRGVVLHSAKQRSTVFLNPKRAADFLQEVGTAKTPDQKDSVIESYFTKGSGTGVEGQFQPPEGTDRETFEKGIRVEAHDHPEVARQAPHLLPEIVKDELRLDPKAYEKDEDPRFQFSPTSDPRAIAPGAAVQTEDGEIFEGPSHQEALKKAYDAGYSENSRITEGFITNTGKFVDRIEGYKRALAANQIKQGQARLDSDEADMLESYGLERAQMQPKTFVVRHGSTEMNNADPNKDLIRGHIDVPLDNKGRKEAEQTAQQIAEQGGVKHIIASDLGRTVETAKTIQDANPGATITEDPGLRPWHFGPTIEGHPTSQMLPRIKELTENPDQRPPGGETFNEFKDRFLDAFHRAQDTTQDANAAIVTHYRGTKLLDAWRAAGVDNDNVSKAVFEAYDKDKAPGHVDVIDKTGAALGESTKSAKPQKAEIVDSQLSFMPKEKKEKTEKLIHYTTQEGLKELKPEFHGTGLAGAESARKKAYPELWVPRTYFGTRGYEKEAALGDVRYKAEVSKGKLYDFQEDPQGLYPSSKELEAAGYAPFDNQAAASLYEKRIHEAGFEGYINRDANAVAKFTATPVQQLIAGQYMPSPEPRALRSAAVRDPETGQIFEGPFHAMAVANALGLPSYKNATEKTMASFEHGFTTNQGEFLNRAEAADRAAEMKQLAATKQELEQSPSFQRKGGIGIEHLTMPTLTEMEENRKTALPEPTQFLPADSAGVTNRKDIAEARKAWAEKGVESPYFKKWFGDSKVVDESGNPQVVYHGTTHKFSAFGTERGNPENSLGVGHYFTTDKSDAAGNYSTATGPDLQNRIQSHADYLQGTKEISREEAMRRAAREMTGKVERVIPAYLKLENPVVLDREGNTSTRFNYEYDESTGQETGTSIDLYNSLLSVARDHGVDGQKIWNDITQNGADDLNAYDVWKGIKDSDEAMYGNDPQGRLMGSEIARQVFQDMGFDGIELTHPAEEFPGMSIDPNTKHFVAFNAEQVKGIQNRGTFSQQDPRYQFMPTEGDDFKSAEKLPGALAKGRYAIVTATREAAGDANNETNKLANENLERALIADGYNPIHAGGEYKGVDQGKSFIVPGMTSAEAINYGKLYGQESVITPHGLVFSDGSGYHPMKPGGIVVGDEAKKRDGWTQAEGGPPFSLDFDFDKKAQFSPAAQTDLFGAPVPEEKKTGLSTLEKSKLTKAGLAQQYPEVVIPKKRDQAISSDIVGSPLYKEAFKKGGEKAAVSAFADRLESFAKEYQDRPAFKDGAAWYDHIAPAIKKAFGKTGQIFAEFLAATSPGQTPDLNFKDALQAHDRFVAGDYDKKIEKYTQGLEMAEDEKKWRAWLGKHGTDLPANSTPETFLGQWIDFHDLKLTKHNGKLFGHNSVPVLNVAARKWLADAGPKTSNFVKNLLGTGNEATIDLWADRTMRWAGYEGAQDRWRILPENKSGVDDKDFYFAQKVFAETAKRLGMRPDQLQGALWFAEKQRWADNGWSPLNLGTYEPEFAKIPAVRAKIAQEQQLRELSKSIAPLTGTQEEFSVEPRNIL